jgi:hypothetical protein
MDPITLAIVLAGRYLAGKSANKSNSVTCRACGGEIDGGYKITKCCRSNLCPNCFPGWCRAGGGTTCVYCGKRHP